MVTGALEGRPIEGLAQRPRSFASCKHNSERSLRVLRLRANMPLDFLYLADEIARGDPGALLGLLSHMLVIHDRIC
ncbi:hypothetical protein T492DRAFT_894533 [Pavlovales sp. CCMP2436]|nr:hypothetical protein T492DRAFT_894533 [Pavlovales sp. CCMP2436]